VVDGASGWAVKMWAARDQGQQRSRGRGGGGRSIGNAACARRGRLGARALEVFGRWADWVGTVAVGRAQFQGLNILFQYFYHSKFEKKQKLYLLFSNFLQTLPSGR
jgi:hypothetical protein